MLLLQPGSAKHSPLLVPLHGMDSPWKFTSCLRIMKVCSTGCLRLICITVAGLVAPLNRFVEGALYKFLNEWMNEFHRKLLNWRITISKSVLPILTSSTRSRKRRVLSPVVPNYCQGFIPSFQCICILSVDPIYKQMHLGQPSYIHTYTVPHKKTHQKTFQKSAIKLSQL